ncbi:MAG: helix-turn-helix domain-containing protein [Defluviitaleaceae bacterium]|nr:helix-turn-helix domain-containing protein [Defluviitaleaceae bacterium]
MPRKAEIDIKDFAKQITTQNQIPILDGSYKYLTPKEYAAFIGKHQVTILNWLADGRIEGAVKVGRNWKIPIKSI